MPLRFNAVTQDEIRSFQPQQQGIQAPRGTTCCKDIDGALCRFMSDKTLQSALDIFERHKNEATSDVQEVAEELKQHLTGRPKGLLGTHTLVDVYYKISTSIRGKFIRFVRFVAGVPVVYPSNYDSEFERFMRDLTVEQARNRLPEGEALKILFALDDRGRQPLAQNLSLSEALYRATDSEREVIERAAYVLFLSNNVVNAS